MLLSANLHHIKVIGNNNSTIEILPRLGSISPTALSKRSVLCVIEQEIADIKRLSKLGGVLYRGMVFLIRMKTVAVSIKAK